MGLHKSRGGGGGDEVEDEEREVTTRRGVEITDKDEPTTKIKEDKDDVVVVFGFWTRLETVGGEDWS